MEDCTSSSHELIQAVLKLKFSKLKLHGEPVASHDALTNDDIQDIFSVLDIFRDEDYCPPVSSCKDGKHLPEKLNQFIENRCRARYFSYQIRNVFFLICFQSYREIKISGFECMLFLFLMCGNCWYCALNPPKLQLGQLHWVTDPTLSIILHVYINKKLIILNDECVREFYQC